MEAILVTVSVLSTLLVVGIVLSVVIVFNKLKGKVDAREFESIHNENKKEVDLIYNEISSLEGNFNNKTNEVERSLWDTIENNYGKTEREFDEIRRMIDSRMDRLYDKIRSLEGSLDGLNSKKKNKKQLLTD